MFSIKKQEGPHGIPEFFEILTQEDKTLYEKLQKDVGSPENRYNRNHRFSVLNKTFEKIRSYCQRDETDKWKRYMVCGICWFDEYMGINTKQLRFLISKSKSSINDALSKMGYKSISIKGEPASLLIETIPLLWGNQSEFRKWSIRKNESPKLNQLDCTNNDVCCEINDFTNENEKYDETEFLDELCKDFDLNNNEANDEFKFINFVDNVDENFDFDFGYDYGIVSSKCELYSNEKTNEIDNFNSMNFAYEDNSRMY